MVRLSCGLLLTLALHFNAFGTLPVPDEEPFLVGPAIWKNFPDIFNPTYRIGDEWGKKEVTDEMLKKASFAFKRTALSTARLGGGTAFYLGKYNGHFIMATNHHVLPTMNCNGRVAQFVLLNLKFNCKQVFGSWSSIDLALFSITVDKIEDEKTLEGVKGNFAFTQDIRRGQDLMTIGFGVADNPNRKIVANQDSDCKVFSGTGEYRLLADPDKLNPADYKAWSFSNGCDVSHGDSGSAMVDRDTGVVVGIIWTGKIPKDKKVQASSYLNGLIKTPTEEIWTELSYSVPAKKMGDVLQELVKGITLEPNIKETLKTLLAG